MERKKVPNIVGVSLDEAKEILEKANIEIEKEKKKIDIFEKSGTVVKVEPKEETSLKKNEKVVLYVSDRKPILIIILLFLLCALLGRTSLGKTIIRGTEDKVIRVLNLSKPTAPEITGGSKEWAQSRVVKVKKDSYAKKGLAYYEYCVGTNLNKCVWKKTNTKNVRVSKTGKWKVVFRGVDKEENTSSNSNIEEVYIDNSNPIINKVSIKNKKVKIEAIDKESGIKKYYYSLDGENYKETRKEFEIKDKIEKISIKVEDKAGNKTTVEVPVEKENEINSTSTTTKVVGEKTTTTIESTTKQPTDVTNPETSTTTGTTTGTIKPTSTTTKKGLEYDIPKINLDKVPVEFVYGSEYELPSYVDFGNDEGTYKCVVEGKEETTTKNLAIGKHLIVCEATSKHNKRTMVEKEVEVKVKSGEEEIWDGWIRLNLSYPNNSTNWEWRIGKEGEIRDGYEYTGWQDYTGPILVKLDDVKDVYIRYDLLGETYIIAPNGKVAVDIEPAKYALEGNEKTKVKIVYEKNVETKEYRIAGGEWEEYTGEFEVEKNTLIEARGIRNEKVYDSDGNYLYTKKVTGTDSVFIGEKNATSGGTTSGGDKGSFEYEVVVKPNGSYTKPKKDTLPSTYLEGPEIKVSPTEMAESVIVKVIPKEKASKTYIKVGDGNYQEYTGEISVSKNVFIRAYYIREEDGKTSETSYYYIQNIKKASKPYVRIDATPDYLSEEVDKVTVKISGSNYTKLEYSLDGVIYEEYKGEITVEQSQTIYAKGTNEFGETIESLDITTRTSPKEKENIEISIEVSPRKEEVEGLINKAKVKITYEKKATKRYYKLGYYGEWKEYTGEFEITDNKTIYAYATGDNAVGNARKSVNYLTTGIASPIISIEPYGKSQQVKVSIEYASTAEITRYKIGNGEYRDYNGPFYVYENETIYAYNKDELGNTGTSEYKIKNIVSAPNYVAIDKGKYYIIKLHYPETSSNREYKWKSDGIWKSYNGYGILLIKPEYKEEFKDIKDGIKVEDEYGKEIIFTDHYYFIDVPFSELMENLFMRWDTEKISAPKIIEIPEEVTREASISIVYNKALVKKLYKIVYEDGEETEWLTYEKPFKIDKNKATIYAKGITRSESESKVGSKTITNIDDTDPEIRVKGNFEKAARQINVTVNAIDEFGIDKVKFAKGEQTKEYFKKNGNGIRNGSSFKVEENGKYTIYAVDYVGNEVIKVIEITNIDKEAPNIRINILTESYGTEAEIEIEYGDSVKKEYKIGKNGSYKEYTGTIKITSNEVLDLVNEDGSLTIYGRGTDEAGNVSEVSEDVYILDLDAPAIPEITAGAGYPILTEYGVKLGSKSYIKYDNRDDITNYYSIDNGATWKVYTGPFEITSGTIKAKSVKKESGLTIEATKKVDMPSDALGPEAYDEDPESYIDIGHSKHNILNISKEMMRKSFYLKILRDTGNFDSIYLYFYDSNNKVISSIKWSRDYSEYANLKIDVPDGCTRISLYNASTYSDGVRVANVTVANDPIINATKIYPKITQYGIENGHNEVTIDYFPTSVQRLYRINDGEWKVYEDKAIRLELNDKIEAKGIDKNGVDSNVVSYDSVLPDDALGPEAYDGDPESYIDIGYSKHNILNISKEMMGRSFYLKILRNTGVYDSIYLYFYDSNNEVISSIKWSRDYSEYANLKIDVPDGCTRISLYNASTYSDGVRVANVTVANDPIINATKIYPKLTEYGIEQAYNEVTIDYFPTSVKRLYRINAGEWKNYEDKSIRLEIGDKLEAKGINKYGKETNISSYTSILPKNALAPEAYDEDESTRVSKGTYYINVDSSLVNKYISFKYTEGSKASFRPNAKMSVSLINADGNEIYKDDYIFSKVDILTNSINIIPGTVKIKFYSPTINSSYGPNYALICEVFSEKIPVITQTSYYPTIKQNEITLSQYEVKITYLSYFTKKLYSIDNGSTWLEYTEPIKVKAGDVIKAKAIDKDGKETDINTYTVTGLTDNLDDKVFDKDKNTSVTLSSKQTKSFILDCVDNEVLRIYTTGKVNAGAYIKLYDKDNQELSTVTLNTDLTTLEIPERSVKASIYSGTSTLTINEVNLREVKAAKENYPEITINDANWTTTKAVEILYPEGTEREYSLDLGTTWNKYTNELTIEKETTIFARSIKEGKTISTNSFIITKVDNVKPIVELQLPSKIYKTFEFKLPTSYIAGSSGANVECRVGNNKVTTTKDLGIGTHEISCTIENGIGIKTEINKTIEIYELPKDSITDFDYTGEEQTYTASKSGIYFIETWGASGGCSLTDGKQTCKDIGYGGYSSGTISLTAGNTLYINVGGKGTDGIRDSDSPGGYNGGGNGVWDTDDDESAGGGGGATHIALRTGLLSTLENYKNDIIMVSGGGGGKSYTFVAGSGGGYKGAITSHTNQSEVSQDKGYLFGKGQDANGAISIYGVAGGGGGFYGGYMNKSGSKTSGSGGSGYIGNTLLKNKSMYCYNCEESSEESTKTIKTTNVSETPTSKYAKIGNGYARITYIGEKFDITEFVSNFDYTGEEQTYTASKSGIYLIETWGASGGCALNNGVTNCTKISYGGYSSGTTFLTAGNTLYINVGGKGTNGILKSNSPGGYNGGGFGTWDNSDDESSGGGGGATHIALRTGLLSTLENYKNDIIMVSGGGGGQSWTNAAGSGGGYKGVTTSTTNQSEVSQDKGYAFGQGQDAKGTASNDGVGGGGGGFYGGYMNNVGGKSSGSGGSGYIGNTLLKNKSMYCYNCEESSEESTKTIKTIDVSEIPTSKYSKIGNGYARITYMGE